jgi:hypothetical protein
MCGAMPLRVASIVLLLGSLGSFALGMVTITFSPLLVGGLQALHQPLPAVCVSDGIATYSGVSLLAGTAPSVDTACLHHIQDFGGAQVGFEPPVAAAALIVVAIIVVNVRGGRGRRLLSLVGPLAAAALLVAGVLAFPGAFESRFRISPAAVAGQPAVGLWLACALLLAVPVLDAVLAGLRAAQRSLAPLEGAGGRGPPAGG